MTKRILDANLHFVGQEPKFKGQINKTQLIGALNWYSSNKNKNDSYRYGHSYIKKHFKVDVSEELNESGTTFGFVCRLISQGAILPQENQKWFDETIADFCKKATFRKKQTKKVLVAEKKVSVQDRVAEKVSEIIGDLEGSIDDYILSKYKNVPSPLAIMQDRTKGMHARQIMDHFRHRRSEFDGVIRSKDPQIVEGYSNFTKTNLKKLVSYCDVIISDALTILGETKKTRKPRKRKEKSTEQIVAKVTVCQSDKEYGLKSIDIKNVLGVSQLWVFNVKTRKLGCYHAADMSGLSINRSTITNFDEAKSVQKIVRKPNIILPEIISGGKVFLRNVVEGINSVEYPLTGRLNKDIVLLRVVK